MTPANENANIDIDFFSESDIAGDIMDPATGEVKGIRTAQCGNYRYTGPVYLTAGQVAKRLGVSITYLRKVTNQYRNLPGLVMGRSDVGLPKWLIPETALTLIPPKNAGGRSSKKLNETTVIARRRAAKTTPKNETNELLAKVEQNLGQLMLAIRGLRQ